MSVCRPRALRGTGRGRTISPAAQGSGAEQPEGKNQPGASLDRRRASINQRDRQTVTCSWTANWNRFAHVHNLVRC